MRIEPQKQIINLLIMRLEDWMQRHLVGGCETGREKLSGIGWGEGGGVCAWRVCAGEKHTHTQSILKFHNVVPGMNILTWLYSLGSTTCRDGDNDASS